MNKCLITVCSFSGGMIVGAELYKKILLTMLKDTDFVKAKLGPKINEILKKRLGEDKYLKIVEILNEK